MLVDVFRSVKSLLKVSRVSIDNSVFRLHYSLTVIVLLAFCIIITTKQYAGDPIDCIRSEAVPQSVINTYCWWVYFLIFIYKLNQKTLRKKASRVSRETGSRFLNSVVSTWKSLDGLKSSSRLSSLTNKQLSKNRKTIAFIIIYIYKLLLQVFGAKNMPLFKWSIPSPFGRIHTTYTIPKSFPKKVGFDVPHPGVDFESDPAEFRYHKYYQW